MSEKGSHGQTTDNVFAHSVLTNCVSCKYIFDIDQCGLVYLNIGQKSSNHLEECSQCHGYGVKQFGSIANNNWICNHCSPPDVRQKIINYHDMFELIFTGKVDSEPIVMDGRVCRDCNKVLKETRKQFIFRDTQYIMINDQFLIDNHMITAKNMTPAIRCCDCLKKAFL